MQDKKTVSDYSPFDFNSLFYQSLKCDRFNGSPFNALKGKQFKLEVQNEYEKKLLRKLVRP